MRRTDSVSDNFVTQSYRLRWSGRGQECATDVLVVCCSRSCALWMRLFAPCMAAAHSAPIRPGSVKHSPKRTYNPTGSPGYTWRH